MLSKKTLTEFREYLTRKKLREIDDLFENHRFSPADVPQERLPGGERRGLVVRYYAGIDFSSPDHVKRLLGVLEDVLIDMPAEEADDRAKLVGYLKRDGFELINNRLVSERLDHATLQGIAGEEIDTEHLQVYLERIGQSIHDDPSLAIGSAKELVEATLKTILRAKKLQFADSEDLPKLLKLVQKQLDLVPDAIPDAAKGAESIRRVLSNLGSIVYGVAELRNLYGSGHGRSGALKGLTPRHARLVVSCAGALCAFLLETYDARKQLGA